MSVQTSIVPTIFEEMTNEGLSDNEIYSQSGNDENDMFFSCADWET